MAFVNACDLVFPLKKEVNIMKSNEKKHLENRINLDTRTRADVTLQVNTLTYICSECKQCL